MVLYCSDAELLAIVTPKHPIPCNSSFYDLFATLRSYTDIDFRHDKTAVKNIKV
jgi:hypothetical protein